MPPSTIRVLATVGIALTAAGLVVGLIPVAADCGAPIIPDDGNPFLAGDCTGQPTRLSLALLALIPGLVLAVAAAAHAATANQQEDTDA